MRLRVRFVEIMIVIVLAMLLFYCANNVTSPQDTYNATKNNNSKEKIKKDICLCKINPASYGDKKIDKVKKSLKVAIVAGDKKNNFWKLCEQGAKEAIKDANEQFGYKGSDSISVDLSFLKEYNIEDQVNLFDVIMGEDPLAIAVSPLDMDAFHTQFDIATENDIAIVTCEGASLDKNVRAHIGVDDKKIGIDSASEVIKYLKNGGEILSMYSSSSASFDKIREESFMDKMLSQSKVKVVGVSHKDKIDEEVRKNAEFTCNDDVKELEKAKQSNDKDEIKEAEDNVTNKTIVDFIVQSFRLNPNVKLINCGDIKITSNVLDALESISNDDADELDYIKDEKERSLIVKCAKKIKIIGCISEDTDIEALKSGKMIKGIVQNPYGLGYATIMSELRAISNDGNDAFVDTGYVWAEKKDLKNKEIKAFLNLK